MRSSRPTFMAQCCLVVLCALALYLRTAAPSVFVGDAGELAVVPEVLTVAHPTGYPLYAQIGKAGLSLLPFGNVAYRTSVFSGMFMAVASGLLTAIAGRVLGPGLFAVFGGMAFCCATTVWSQSVVTEVYGMNAFFVALIILLLLRYQERPNRRRLYLLFFAVGLSFGHHMTTILLLPAIVVVLLDPVAMAPGTVAAYLTGSWLAAREIYRGWWRTPARLVLAAWFALWRLALVWTVLVVWVFAWRGDITLRRFEEYYLSLDTVLIVFSDLKIVYGLIFPLAVILFLLARGNHTLASGVAAGARWILRMAPVASTAATVLLIGASLNLYTPIRSLPLTPRNAVCGLYWGNTTSFQGLIEHMSGRMFQSLMFTAPIQSMDARLQSFFFVNLAPQFTPLALPLLLLGWVLLYRERRRFWYPLAMVGVFNVYFCVNYGIPDIEVFYIPTYITMAVALATGMRHLWMTARSTWRLRGAAVACGLSPLLLVIVNFQPCDRARYFIAYDYGMNVLNTVRGSATLLTQGWITPYIIGYLQTAHHMRTDDPERVTHIIEGKQRIFQRIITGQLRLPPGFRLYTTVPLEVKGGREAYSTLKGLIYEIGLNEDPIPMEHIDYWSQYLARDQTYLDPSIAMDPQTRSIAAKYYYLRGEEAFAEGRADEGLALCQRAILVAPGNKQVYNNLGAIYFKHGFNQIAEQACLNALYLDPEFQQARHNLGNIYYKMGKHDKALEMFRKNNIMGARIEFFRPVVAQIYMEQGNYKEAAQEFENALRVDSTNVEMLNQLGVAYLYAREYASALARFEEALALEPDRAETYNNLGLYYEAVQELPKAESSFLRATEMSGGAASAFNNLGRLKAMNGDFEQARQYFERAIEANPRMTVAWNNLGGAYLSLGIGEKARESWTKSLEIDPDQPKIADAIKSMEEGK